VLANPRAARPASIAAPSAWDARQPKFLIQNRSNSQVYRTRDAVSKYNRDSMASEIANDKLYKAEYQGSGTFLITKPKRKAAKLRQSRLKHPKRGARK
jgi:hypothetical protein